MRKTLFRKIQQIIFAITLCTSFLLVLPEATSGQENTTETQNYIINLHDATKMGDTYWFTEDNTITIVAGENYYVSADQAGPWETTLSYTYNEALPEEIYTYNGNVISDAIPLNIAWDGEPPYAQFSPGLPEYTESLTPVENKVPTRDNRFSIQTIDDGSGVKSIEYYVADGPLADENNGGYFAAVEEINSIVGEDWILVEGDTANGILPYYGSNVIYAKITDYAGNQVYLNSAGIVLFDQPFVNVTNIEYTKQETDNPTFEIELKGNIFEDEDIILKDAGGTVVNGFTPREDENDTSWGYMSGDGVVTLSGKFLDTLNVNETYTITINYMPMIEQYPTLDTGSVYMEINPSEIGVTIKKQTLSAWGEAETRPDGVVQYVDNTSKTSVEISPSNITDNMLWIAEASNGETAWYGMDLSENAFDLDQTHRFYVQWLSSIESDYAYYFNQINASVQNSVDATKNWIFRIGVEETNGTKVQPDNNKVDIYVQLDDSWDKDNIKAYAIDSNEQIAVSFAEKTAPSGGADTYAVLELQHFSPYIIYVQKEVISNPPTSIPPSYYYPIYSVPVITEPVSTEPATTETMVGKPKDTEATSTDMEESIEPDTEPKTTEQTEETEPEKEQELGTEQMNSDSANGAPIDSETKENGIGIYMFIAVTIGLLLFGWIKYKKKK